MQSKQKQVKFEYPKGIQSQKTEKRYIILEVLDYSSSLKDTIDKTAKIIDSVQNPKQNEDESPSIVSQIINSDWSPQNIFGKSSSDTNSIIQSVEPIEPKKQQSPPQPKAQSSNTNNKNIKTDYSPVTNIIQSFNKARAERNANLGETLFQVQLPFPSTFQEKNSQSWEKSKSVVGSALGQLEDIQVPYVGMNQTKFIGSMANYQGIRKPIVNPGYFQDYTGPEVRQFSMEWSLVPNSKEEASEIQKILYNLKKFSSPQMAQGFQAVLLQPFIFKITIMNETINQLQGMDTLVCTSIDVDYGGKSQLRKDGQPKAYRLSMEFSERRQLTFDEY